MPVENLRLLLGRRGGQEEVKAELAPVGVGDLDVSVGAGHQIVLAAGGRARHLGHVVDLDHQLLAVQRILHSGHGTFSLGLIGPVVNFPA